MRKNYGRYSSPVPFLMLAHEKIRMELFKGISVINSSPAIYIKKLDAICIADLHLGYEGIMAEYYGVFLPKTQFHDEMEELKFIIEEQKASEIILNGDVKHEFSETSYHEYRELFELFKFLSQNFEKIIVVKGNHDNFIIRVTRKFPKIELVEMYEIKNFIFLHGHKLEKPLKLLSGKFLVLAHEHPAIALRDEIGKEKVKCFLYGELKGIKIIVLPAFSTLMRGSELNYLPREEFLSPILRSLNVEELNVLLVDKELGVKRLGKLKYLREI